MLKSELVKLFYGFEIDMKSEENQILKLGKELFFDFTDLSDISAYIFKHYNVKLSHLDLVDKSFNDILQDLK